ncbi:DUF1801 domain-containing protein [Pseudorhodobacter antarcticus]|uniref:DUF1801 domain-containing protein n=1 Tax=Pseudorhodobacter antarcticus TaxID=1077947 RepID=UPI001FD2CE8C|nr:DUF1801 domain-containing protein [Pseudorhodobacter antarcticus]
MNSLVHACAPQVVRVPKYGGTLYTLWPDQKEGQFCGVFVYKDHVQLAFSHGTALLNPAGVLTGTGKLRCRINFARLDGVSEDAVGAVVAAAVAFSAGQTR